MVIAVSTSRRIYKKYNYRVWDDLWSTNPDQEPVHVPITIHHLIWDILISLHISQDIYFTDLERVSDILHRMIKSEDPTLRCVEIVPYKLLESTINICTIWSSVDTNITACFKLLRRTSASVQESVSAHTVS